MKEVFRKAQPIHPYHPRKMPINRQINPDQRNTRKPTRFSNHLLLGVEYFF
ncbi:hypothetical protein QUB72_08285 [Enterococcus faecium]|nr:hypothetical protein [Enterococcus faecium]